MDTRAWIRDPEPLFRTNVEALRNVLDVAAEIDLERFVFTNSLGTIGRGTDGPATGLWKYSLVERVVCLAVGSAGAS